MSLLNEEIMEFDCFTVTLDDDTEIEYAIVDQFEYEENTYAVCVEAFDEEVDFDGQLYLYRYEGDEVVYIENEEEYQNAIIYYSKLMEEDAKAYDQMLEEGVE